MWHFLVWRAVHLFQLLQELQLLRAMHEYVGSSLGNVPGLG